MGFFYRGLTDRYLANDASGLKASCEKEGSGFQGGGSRRPEPLA